VHTPWGVSSYYLEHLFDLIIISLFNLFFESFDCSLHLLEVYHRVILFCLQSLILNIVLFPSNICLCISACVFTHFFWICTPFWRNSHYIGLLSFFCPFWQWMPMGEKFRGFQGNWVLYFGFVLKHFPFILCIVVSCFAWLSI
jgi:hypothetical protein